jgi:tRNA A-37 threonylcarbamoyl transferase component Bud32
MSAPQHSRTALHRTAGELRLVRRGGMGICVPECSRACLIRWIDYPELPLRAHVRETLKCGRSSLVVRADVPVGDAVVRIAYKRYSRRNLWKVVCGALRSSRAFRAWRMGYLLRDAGIATPRPLVAITPRPLSRRVDSYLATEFVDGFPLHDLAERISALPAALQVDVVMKTAEIVGRMLGRLHGAGFRHRDLKTGNVLIAGDVHEPATMAAVLIDLDGVSRRRTVSRSARIRDLSRLGVCFGPETPQRLNAGARFVKSYLASCGDAEWRWRDCWRRLVAAIAVRNRQRSRKQRRAA